MLFRSPIDYGPARNVNPVPRRLADTWLARQEIGFEATVSFEHGLNALVEWWQQSRLNQQVQRDRRGAAAAFIGWTSSFHARPRGLSSPRIADWNTAAGCCSSRTLGHQANGFLTVTPRML